MIVGSAPLSGFVGLDLPNWSDLFTLKADAATYNGKCGANLTWSLDTDAGVLEISGTGNMYFWSFYSDVPWYSYRSSIKTVEIGNSVTSIGDYAFYDYTSLTSVTIPDNVESIGDYAFSSCASLTSITVKEGNPNYSSDEYGVLFNKDKTELIQYPIGNTRTSYTIPNSVTSIGEYAFSGCTSLTSVTIPDSITSIGKNAFYSCKSLTSVTIPDSVTSIGNGAFYNTGIYNDASNWENDVLYIGNHLIEAKSDISGDYIIKSGTKTIADYAFEDCTSLTSVTIGRSVESIGNNAFNYCKELAKISIDENNSTYDSRENCNAIIKTKTNTLVFGCKNTTIPDSVTRIREKAFYNCTGLTSIIIPDSVNYIAGGTFDGCSDLKTVVIPDSVTFIWDGAFLACENLTDVYYLGTEEEWNKVIIGGNNDDLLDANIYFNVSLEEIKDEIIVRVKSVSVDDFTMNYKDTVSLTPDIDISEGLDYTVEYSSSNPSVVSVDEEGNVYGAKKGSAEITVTVTDEYGYTVTDTCTVTVSYSVLQWIIVIVLFGWIWY